MLFAAALVASVPCDGSPALACEVNTLAPANSSSVWALMGGHDIKLYQPVSDVLTVTPPPGVAPKALELVFVHGVYPGGFYWHGFQKELAVLGYTSHSFTFATDMTKHIWTMANDLMAFVQANVTTSLASSSLWWLAKARRAVAIWARVHARARLLQSWLRPCSRGGCPPPDAAMVGRGRRVGAVLRYRLVENGGS